MGQYEKAGPFRRSLNSSEAEHLASLLGQALDFRVEPSDVLSIVERFNRYEQGMVGRIAGDIEDHILNYYMRSKAALSLNTELGAHVEIGTLFGGSLLLTLDALSNIGSSDIAIAIDPFTGYYDKKRDSLTGLKVKKSYVEKNLKTMGFGHRPVKIFPHSSHDPNVIEGLSTYKIKSIWIDGDHSYEGVKKDWELYVSMIIPGGYILIDNYRDKAWPGVTKFIDEEVRTNLIGVSIVLELGRSIAFKKI